MHTQASYFITILDNYLLIQLNDNNNNYNNNNNFQIIFCVCGDTAIKIPQ